MEVGFPWKNEGEFRRGEGMSARNKEVRSDAEGV